MAAGNKNLRGWNWIKDSTVLHSDVTMGSVSSLPSKVTHPGKGDTGILTLSFGFCTSPLGMFYNVKEMKPRHAFLFATQWEAKRQPIHPRNSAHPPCA